MTRVTGKDIVAAARSMLGTKFRHQGRRPGVSLDCVGVAVCAARACGLTVVDRRDYSPRPDGISLRAKLAESCDEVFGSIEDGYILAFSELGPGWPHHVAIVTPSGILHASLEHRRVVEHALSDAWRGCIESVWRIRGME